MAKLSGGEYGFLLLTSCLGYLERKPLTVAQMRELFRRSEGMKRRDEHQDVNVYDFVSIGYSPKTAQHIIDLLHDELRLRMYLHTARKEGIHLVTRATESYPVLLRQRLGLDSPGCLWAKGDLSLLGKPAVALVGSRELEADNARFAAEAGRQAALQGYVLISGNARGADKVAQRACLEAGGQVICVVADSLTDKRPVKNVLYLSEDSFDLPFSAARALSRNRVIHAMAGKVFVAQCGYQMGGTWSGTTQNLRFGWSPVFVYGDGSPAAALLVDMGAEAVELDSLGDLAALSCTDTGFL